MNTYYDILRYNAIVCRNASRQIEAITRGDDIFRFACQSLVGSLYDLTKTDLEETAKFSVGASILALSHKNTINPNLSVDLINQTIKELIQC